MDLNATIVKTRALSGTIIRASGGGGGAVNSVNGQTGDVVLTAQDVGALPDTTTIPTKTSDLQNDSGYQTATQVESAIDNHLSAVYKAAGSVASISALPTPSATYLGYVYDVEAAFTTTADFVEGAGIDYPAGTDVAIIAVQSGGSTVYKYDAMSGFVDLSAYIEAPTATANQILYYNGSAWAAKAQTPEVTNSSTGAVSVALDPEKIYHFTGALTSLTLTLTSPASGQLAHYHFDFDSGSTAPTVTIPNTVTMPGGFTVEASKHYEIDILNNYGAVMAW